MKSNDHSTIVEVNLINHKPGVDGCLHHEANSLAVRMVFV